MPGPAPKDPSVRVRRNNPRKDFRQLPAAGRVGEVPAWPLPTLPRAVAQLEFTRDQVARLQAELETTKDGRKKGRIRRDLNKAELLVMQLELQIEQARDAEVALWTEMWSWPQAIIWEEGHSHREVAQYVRWKIAAEQGDLKAAAESRQLADRLFITPLAMLRGRVEIDKHPALAAVPDRRTAAPQRSTARTQRGRRDPRTILRSVD